MSIWDNTEEVIPQETRGITDTIFAPIVTLSHILDTPASIFRGIFAGKDVNDILAGIMNPTKRATGREVLSNLGVTQDFGKIGSFDLGSLGTEILLDPLIFTSSITGLTKAGRAAKVLSESGKTIERSGQILKNIQTIHGLKTLEEAGALAPEVLATYSGALKRQKGLLEQGITTLAGTRKEQIAAGQRGLGFSVLGYGPEIIPKELNVALTKPIEAANKGWDVISGATGKLAAPFRSAFSTKKLTEPGQFFTDMGDFAVAVSDQKLEKVSRKLEQQFKELAKSTKVPIEEAKKTILEGVLFQGRPEAIELHFKNSLDLVNEKLNVGIARNVQKYSSGITESQRILKELKTGLSLDEDALPAFLENFEKQYGFIQGNTIQEKIALAQKSLDIQIGTMEGNIKRLKTTAEKSVIELTEKRTQFLDEAKLKAGLIGDKGTLPRDLVDNIRETFKELLDLEQSNGIFIEALNDWRVNYAPLILNPKGKVLLDSNPEFGKIYAKVLSAKIPNSKERFFKNMTHSELNQWFRDKFKIDFDVFSEDLTQVITERMRQSNIAVSNARNINAAIQLLADSTAGADKIHVGELLKSSEISGFLPRGGKELIRWGPDAQVHDIAQVLKKAGIQDVWLPKDIVKDLTIASQYSIGDLENVFRLIDPLNTIYRSFLTSVPAYTGTNLVGNMWMNSLVGLLPFTPKGIKTYKNSASILVRDFAQRKPEHWLSRHLQDTKAEIPILKSQLTDVEQKVLDLFEIFAGGNRNIISEIKELTDLERQGSVQRFFMGESPSKVSKAIGDIKGFNSFIEESSKLAHFMHQLEKGLSPLEAGKSVKKYLFDYKDLTGFEKKVMRRMVLFYTFARKNLPLALSETILNRQAYLYSKIPLSTMRTEDFVPDYILDQGNIRLGPGHYIDLKQPLFEANRFGPQSGGPQRFFDKILQQLVPQIKMPMELIAGREFFRGVPLEELNKVPGPLSFLPTVKKIETKQGKTEYRSHPFLAEILRNVPWTRQSQIISDITSEDIKPITSILGLRERQLDPTKLRLQKTIAAIKQRLGNDPTVKMFQTPYSIEQEPNEKVKGLLEQLRKINNK